MRSLAPPPLHAHARWLLDLSVCLCAAHSGVCESGSVQRDLLPSLCGAASSSRLQHARIGKPAACMHSGPVAAAKEGEPPATVSWASVCVYAARCDCGTRAPRLRRPSSRSAARLLPPKVLQQDYPRAVARRCRLQQPVSKLCRVGGILAPNVVSQPVVISQRVLRRAGCANQRGTPPPAQRECAWSSCRSPPSSSSGGSISASDTALVP